MAIITIAREIAALGEELPRELSRVTNYKLIDREFLEKRLGDYGLDADKREKYDEKKPGFWASLSQERDDYLHFLKAALFEETIDGDCIVVGRGGAAIYKSVPSHISIKVVAPLAVRIERVMKTYGCDERHALQIVEESDHTRAGFHKYFFSVDWADPRGYDLTLNSGKSDATQEAKLIDDYRKTAVSATKEDPPAAPRRAPARSARRHRDRLRQEGPRPFPRGGRGRHPRRSPRRRQHPSRHRRQPRRCQIRARCHRCRERDPGGSRVHGNALISWYTYA